MSKTMDKKRKENKEMDKVHEAYALLASLDPETLAQVAIQYDMENSPLTEEDYREILKDELESFSSDDEWEKDASLPDYEDYPDYDILADEMDSWSEYEKVPYDTSDSPQPEKTEAPVYAEVQIEDLRTALHIIEHDQWRVGMDSDMEAINRLTDIVESDTYQRCHELLKNDVLPMYEEGTEQHGLVKRMMDELSDL